MRLRRFGVFGILLGAMSLFTMGCPGKNNPSSPAGATSTPTPTPGIFWQSAQVYRYNSGVYASVNLTANGQAVTNASVVVTGSTITTPVTLAYTSINNIGGVNYANYFTNNTLSTGLNYQPAYTYTLTTVSGPLTAAATLVSAPGNITVNPTGSQASWVAAGATNTVWVVQGGVTLYTSGNAATPFSIPVTAYAPGGVFNVSVSCSSISASATGGAAGSYLTLYDELSTSVTVLIPDPNLLSAIQTVLIDNSVIANASVPITSADLATITSLVVDSAGVSSIEGLEYCTNMTNLELTFNSITNLTPLTNLTSLTSLDLNHDQISDISALSGLTNLTSLDLYENQISDISSLSGLTSLTDLLLGNNQIVTVTALSGLTNLTNLDLDDNLIVTITALSSLTKLTGIDLHNNQVVTISALTPLTDLTYLDLSYNQVTDLSALVSDDTDLGANEADVIVTGNPLSTLATGTQIPELTTAGVNVTD